MNSFRGMNVKKTINIERKSRSGFESASVDIYYGSGQNHRIKPSKFPKSIQIKAIAVFKVVLLTSTSKLIRYQEYSKSKATSVSKQQLVKIKIYISMTHGYRPFLSPFTSKFLLSQGQRF